MQNLTLTKIVFSQLQPNLALPDERDIIYRALKIYNYRDYGYFYFVNRTF